MTPRFLQSLNRLALTLHPGPAWADFARRALFIFRQLRNYPHSKQWLDYLATSRMVTIIHNNPSLYRKSIRPYVSIHWPDRAKVAALIHHYDFLARRLAPAIFRQIVSPAGGVLLSFPVKNGDLLTIRLRYDGKFRKEGETTVDLESAKHGCRVSSVTFVVAASETGEPCLVVGAVSGLPAGVDKDIIKHTAKAMFGLRPKALLLFALQELAQAWGVKAILGVGSRIHTSQHVAYTFNRSRRFAIAYDQFWEEIGGTRRSDGFFSLPLISSFRTVEEIEPHKRSLYRQRYALIGELQGQLRSGEAPPPAAKTNGEPGPRPENLPMIMPLLASLILCVAPFTTAVLHADPEPWSIHGQTTVVEQWHGDFTAPYSGAESLSPAREDRHTATLTLFLGRALWPGGELFLNPEMAQGTGLSGTLGVGGFPNGEATRAGSTTPEYNTARLFFRQTFGLGGPPETIVSGSNQLAGTPDRERIVLTLGKLSAVDLFDANAYTHDPRTQLLNWALMDNGAWDYPADAKGYTVGFTADLKLTSRSLRWGIFMEPAEANGRRLDPHLAQALGQAFEWEERFQTAGRPGALRALAYWNRAHMGNYTEALQSAETIPPDITLHRRYRSKAGAGLNWEQEIVRGLGAFARIGFNDGRNETWAFTEIDRTASVGLSLNGAAWHLPDDTLAIALVANGLSAGHRRYLTAGGDGFIIGDGALRYGPEEILETNYDWKPTRWLALAADLQLISHPGYNRDRGPVAVAAIRLHSEF